MGAWIATALLAGFWLLGALANGQLAYKKLVRRELLNASFVPVVPGVAGALAVLACPLGAVSERLPFALLPPLLDFGTGAWLTLGPVFALLARKQGHRP